MSRTRTLAALALAAALASAVPAAARPTTPCAAHPASAPGWVQEARAALAWLADLWTSGRPERAATARDEAGGGIDPNGTCDRMLAAPRPAHPPAGGGIDPNG